jgi:hypothetical protein
METTESLHEGVEVLELQIEALIHRSHLIERRFRWWCALGCGLLVVGLFSLPLPPVSAQQDKLELEGNHFNLRHSHLFLEEIGRNFIVSSGLMTQTLSPSVAYNSEDNEYMVVWFDLRNQATTGNDVFAQRVSANGRLRGDSIPISNDPEAQVDPSIAYSRIDNSYLMSWRSQFPPGVGSDDAVGRIVSNDGMLIGNEFIISDRGFGLSSAYNSQNNNYLATGLGFVLVRFYQSMCQVVHERV